MNLHYKRLITVTISTSRILSLLL